MAVGLIFLVSLNVVSWIEGVLGFDVMCVSCIFTALMLQLLAVSDSRR